MTEQPTCRCGTPMHPAGWQATSGWVSWVCPELSRGHEYVVDDVARIMFGMERAS